MLSTMNLPENMAFFPGVTKEAVLLRQAASIPPRPTVRVRPWAKQGKLPLQPGAPSWEQRINAAKNTSANFREEASKAGAEADALRGTLGKDGEREKARHRQERYNALADNWDKRVLEIIAERDRATAQQSFSECGRPHSQPEDSAAP